MARIRVARSRLYGGRSAASSAPGRRSGITAPVVASTAGRYALDGMVRTGRHRGGVLRDPRSSRNGVAASVADLHARHRCYVLVIIAVDKDLEFFNIVVKELDHCDIVRPVKRRGEVCIAEVISRVDDVPVIQKIPFFAIFCGIERDLS